MIARASRSLLLTCTATSLLWVATPAFAQQAADEQGTTVLRELEIKGKKAANVASDTPLATQNTAEDIRKKEVSDINDLGNTTEPGVEYLSKEGSVYIRGLSGARVLTVVDGIPIPFLENFARAGGPTGSATNANGGGDSFDFSSLSAVDVLRGADSSRVGSGVLGGALVLRTLEPEDLIEDGRNWGGLAKLTYDSKDRGITGALAVAGRFDATSVLLQGSYKRGHETATAGNVDSFGRTRTKANPLDLDQNNVLFKLRHDIEGGHRIGVTAERFFRKDRAALKSDWTVVNGSAPRPGMPDTRYAYPVDGYFGFEDTLRERVSLDYTYASPDAESFIQSADAVAYWQRLTKHSGAEGTQVRTATGLQIPYYRNNELKQSAYGFNGNVTGQFSSGSLDHTIRAGLDISAFNSTHYITATPKTAEQSDIPEVDGTKVGIYLEDRIAFGDSGFAVTPGLRFDWHSYRPKASADFTGTNPGYPIFGIPAENSGSRVTPKVLLTYDVTPSVQFFGQWSMAYRAPTINELYLNFTNATTGYAQLGNPDLKAETGHGFEAGANFGSEDFGGRVVFFHNRYNNFISTTPMAADPNYPQLPFGISRYININEVQLTGFELAAHKSFSNGVRLHGALSYTYGRNVTDNVVLRDVAPVKLVAGIGYEQERWGVDLTGVFAGKMWDDNRPNTFDAPGYAIANLTGWWEPEQVKGMRIQAGVYNLFDTTHYNALSVRAINPNSPTQPLPFYSEPGRSFKISLTQKF